MPWAPSGSTASRRAANGVAENCWRPAGTSSPGPGRFWTRWPRPPRRTASKRAGTPGSAQSGTSASRPSRFCAADAAVVGCPGSPGTSAGGWARVPWNSVCGRHKSSIDRSIRDSAWRLLRLGFPSRAF